MRLLMKLEKWFGREGLGVEKGNEGRKVMQTTEGGLLLGVSC